MPTLRAEYFTDPLCPWSWGNEPYYRKLREEFKDQIRWRHRMGELFKPPDARREGAEILVKDQEEASLKTEMPIDLGFSVDYPFSLSLPACVAVKAVGFQGWALEDRYLRRLREAALVERRPVTAPADLLAIAREIPEINLNRFEQERDSEAARAAFREDWEATREPLPDAKETTQDEERVRYSFPTLVLSNQKGAHRVLVAGDSYESYLKAIDALDPTIKRYAPPGIESFVRTYRNIATKEVAVVCEFSWKAAEAGLEELVKLGQLRKRRAGHFDFYSLAGPL